MRCKKHYSDLSSTVGVCASCLRERLVILLAAQAQADSQTPRASSNDHRKLHAPPQRQPQPPPVFPRSVSPYVTRRKTEPVESRYNFDQRFYSTPQLGHAAPDTKKKRSKFSLFSSLFRLRSDKPVRDSGLGFESSTSSTSSPFRSGVFNGCRKKGPEVVTGGRMSCRDRGMSPEGESDSESGYSSESEERRRTRSIAAAVPVVKKKKAGGLGREISLCLSPLVRPSPNRYWGNKSGFSAADVAFSGEFRKTPPHLSTANSFCKNRSRKLADFGRGFR